jgi:CRP/FNR family cyclic AMP-dependent transcriptional regulator
MNVISDVLKLGRPLKAASGQRVFAQGKPARYLYYLRSGSIVTRVSSLIGREAMVMDVPSGQFVPVAALLGGAVSYIVDGIAQSDCELVAIEITKLRKLLLKDARVSNYFLELSLQRLERILSQFVDVALLDATGRIAKWLLDVARGQSASLHNGMVIQLDVSTRVVGLATAGMARETISRQLSFLVRKGIIKRSKKSVTLLDIARLQAISDGTVTATSKNADML